VKRAIFVLLILGIGVSPVVAHEDSSQPGRQENTGAVQETNKNKTSADTEPAPTGGQQSGTSGGWFLEFLLPGLTQVEDVHPLFVHFPIVLVWTALLFVGFSWFGYEDEFLRTARWMFWLLLIALPVTLTTGFLAVAGWGEGHAVGHRNWMLLTTVAAYLLFGLERWFADRKRLYRIVLTVGLVIVTVFMTIGADRGAWLVYVEGAGVEPAEHVHEH
jgi:uncharacterized membrane protein